MLCEVWNMSNEPLHWTNDGFWFARTFWENIIAYNYQYSHDILSYIKIYITVLKP